MDEYSIESMVKNGIFGNSGLGYGEHLVRINLKFQDFSDEIEWDICNPDNQPEEFAAQMISDLMLEPAQDYFVAITYEIRKQIMLEICRRVQKFSNIYENYVQNEMEIYEF